MKNLKENAERAREILIREKTPLTKECETVVVADLKKVLSNYFSLKDDFLFTIEKTGDYKIKITVTAQKIKSFGVIRC